MAGYVKKQLVRYKHIKTSKPQNTPLRPAPKNIDLHPKNLLLLTNLHSLMRAKSNWYNTLWEASFITADQ